MVRLNTETQLFMMPGSASSLCGWWVAGVGWWWWVWVMVVESKFSDRFGYSLRLALAKPNKMT